MVTRVPETYTSIDLLSTRSSLAHDRDEKDRLPTISSPCCAEHEQKSPRVHTTHEHRRATPPLYAMECARSYCHGVISSIVDPHSRARAFLA